MRLTKIDKDAHWWVKEKTDWAVEDKSGNWWIYRRKNPIMKTQISPKRKASGSNRFSLKDYMILMLSTLLGITLGFLVAMAINMIY